MTHDDHDLRAGRAPGPEVTAKLFRDWQDARRGRTPAEDMTNPVWQWMFRCRVDPYHANERFKSGFKKRFGSIDYPSKPRWAGCRMGQSKTRLSDGRTFWIAGEHEDFYDPDFYIYNDVIIEYPNGNVKIFGYPESAFRPTDFHSATPILNDREIVLIGNIGYSNERDRNSTQIFILDTESLETKKLEPHGEPPGWINSHEAVLNDTESAITVRGGSVVTGQGLIENIDDWSLSLDDFSWTRLTRRHWTRFQIRRSDETGLHLWHYDMRQYSLNQPVSDSGQHDDLAEELGAEPNMEAYHALFQPSLTHTRPPSSPEEEEDYRTKKILIDGVLVRFVDDMDHLSVTIEGEIDQAKLDVLVEDLLSKLVLVENADCQVKWIE